MLPDRIGLADLDKLCLPREATKGLHYERHLVFTIKSNAMRGAGDADFQRNEITCFRCGERGHKKGECRTYRTKFCRRPQLCDDVNCPFAHSSAQLRTPWLARCIRVIRSEGHLKKLGCGHTGHTFRECPHHDRYNPSRICEATVAFCDSMQSENVVPPKKRTGHKWDVLETFLNNTDTTPHTEM